VPHTLLGHWPMVVGMAVLAVAGVRLAPGPVGEAIALAAAAALGIDIVAGITQRVRSAGDRELAGQTVGGAATSVLDSPLQATEGSHYLTEEVPSLTLRGIAGGGRLYVKRHDPASGFEAVRRRLFDDRQLYAATAGTQVALLDERAMHVAVDAQRELDAAIIALDRLRETQWRHGVLGTSGSKGRPLEAYGSADLAPDSERFHRLAASAAALLTWLERRRGRAPRRQTIAPDTHGADRSLAARALVAQAVEDIIGDVGPLSSWTKDSSLAAVDVRAWSDVAAVDELLFTGQAIGSGWESLHSVTVQGAQQLDQITRMVESDLPAGDLAEARHLHEQLVALGKLAFATGDGERSANNARTTQMTPDKVQGAEDVYATRRHAYRDLLRETLKEARAMIANAPSGF
jgi:hypothetical protein